MRGKYSSELISIAALLSRALEEVDATKKAARASGDFEVVESMRLFHVELERVIYGNSGLSELISIVKEDEK